MGKASRGPEDTNSNSEQFKRKPGIQCHTMRKEKKYYKPQCNKASTCRYCGSSHPPQRCPAYSKRYGKCGKMNHFRTVYRST